MPQGVLEVPKDDSKHIRKGESIVQGFMCLTGERKTYYGSVHCSFNCGNESVEMHHLGFL